MSLGEQVKLRRLVSNMTYRGLAKAAGVNMSDLFQIEHDRVNPGVKTIVRLADTFRCSVDALLDRAPVSIEQVELAGIISRFMTALQDYRTAADELVGAADSVALAVLRSAERESHG